MRTPVELYVLGAVARREVFRDWEGDQVWPLVSDPGLLPKDQADVLAELRGAGLVVLGPPQRDRRQWWELTDKALED